MHDFYCDRHFLIPICSVVVILPVIWFKNISAFGYVSIDILSHYLITGIKFDLTFDLTFDLILSKDHTNNFHPHNIMKMMNFPLWNVTVEDSTFREST